MVPPMSISTAPSMTLLTTVIPSSSEVITSASGTATQSPAAVVTTSQSSTDDNPHVTTVFNYYFLFLALFGVFVAVMLWYLHKQKKRRKEQTRLSEHNALARDLQGWTNGRRFMHGRYGRNNGVGLVRREEGLNEHGDAPPPYQPKDDTTVGEEPISHPNDALQNISAPPRTVSRGNVALPPEYHNISPNDIPLSNRRVESGTP